MIGIIAALDEEIDNLILSMEEISSFNFGKKLFKKGKIYGKDLVAVKCGVGKVNAAVSATILCECFKADIIINIGVAGALNNNIKKGDIFLVESSVQHDVDLHDESKSKGMLYEYNTTELKSDIGLTDLIKKVLLELDFQFFTGIIATGDEFINSKEKGVWLSDTFGASACDMETAAIAQVCLMLNKKFAALRCITDRGDEQATEDFDKFLSSSAAKSIKCIKNIIKYL